MDGSRSVTQFTVPILLPDPFHTWDGKLVNVRSSSLPFEEDLQENRGKTGGGGVEGGES